MSAAWLERAEELLLRESYWMIDDGRAETYWSIEGRTALERALQAIEANVADLGGPALTQDDRERAERVADRLREMNCPPHLRARAARVADLLAPPGRELAASAAELAARARAARAAELSSFGLPQSRLDALAAMYAGPYDVVLRGAERDVDEDAMRVALGTLGYQPADAERAVKRAIHIDEPQVLAYLLDEDVAIDFKLLLEAAGARVRIKRHTGG